MPEEQEQWSEAEAALKAMTSFEHRAPIEQGMPTKGVGLLIGRPKSGKTSLLADFPDAAVAEIDEGDADHVAGRIADIKDILDKNGEVAVVGKDSESRDIYGTKLWVFRQWLKAAVASPTIKTIGIDTLDSLVGLFQDEIALKNGVANMNVRQKGVDGRGMWGDLKTKVENLVEYLNQCGKLVVFCSHWQAPKQDDEGRVIAPARVSVSGSSADYIQGRAKFIGYCYKEEIGRDMRYFVTFKGGPLADWGSRVKELNNKTIELPEKNPFGAIAAAFKKAAPAETKASETKEPEKIQPDEKETKQQTTSKPKPRGRAAAAA